MQRDFSVDSTDDRAPLAVWETQDVAKGEELVGFYFKKRTGKDTIKQFGLLTVQE